MAAELYEDVLTNVSPRNSDFFMPALFSRGERMFCFIVMTK